MSSIDQTKASIKTTIDTYKHNKVARRYNRAVSSQTSKKPLLVGAAGGATVGAALASSFSKASAHEVAQKTIGGTVGGAYAGVLAVKSRQSFNKRMMEMHERQQGQPVERIRYRKGGK